MLYADDTQLYVEFEKGSMDESITLLELCIDDIKAWMSHILKLNEDKTEVIIFGSRNHMEVIPSICVRVGQCTITPTRTVCNLGAYFDSQVNMEDFIIKSVETVNSRFLKLLECVNIHPKIDVPA